jgi:hypothetical protein
LMIVMRLSGGNNQRLVDCWIVSLVSFPRDYQLLKLE